MVSRVEQSFEIAGTPEQIFELLHDREFAHRRCLASGAESAELLEHEQAEGSLRLVMRTRIARSELPRAVRGFVRGEPGATRTEVWRKTDTGYAAQVTIELEGAPTRINGTVGLGPAAEGTLLTAGIDVQVAVPMFGPQIEATVVRTITDGLAAEAEMMSAEVSN